MSITRVQGLTPDAEEVQEHAIQAVKENLPGLVAAYRKRFGMHVGTDFARELFPEYSASKENRLKYATAVQRSASVVADAVFAQILEESHGGSALFTAGGTGAGKTSSILAEGVAQQALQDATVIFDGNLNSYHSSKTKIEMALNAGLKVVVVFVHRHPVEAYLQGVLPRAVEQGRTVPIEGHMRIHRDARKTFLKVHKAFGINNENLSFMVLSNTGHVAEVFPADIDYLKAVDYDEEAVVKAIKEGLDCALNEQKISQTLYAASCGSPGE
jgi:hypothetical protein